MYICINKGVDALSLDFTGMPDLNYINPYISMYVYIYIYIHIYIDRQIYICKYVYVHIYI
jgi:hypothetical protein